MPITMPSMAPSLRNVSAAALHLARVDLGDALPLVTSHLVLILILIVGPTVNDANRVAGLLSVGVSGVLVGWVLTLPGNSRRRLTAGLTVIGCIVAGVAYAMVDTLDIGPSYLKGWWPTAISMHWPKVDPTVVDAIASTLGLVGSMTPNTIAFLTMPAVLVAASLASTSGRLLPRGLWILVAAFAAVIVLGSASRTSTAGLIVGLVVLLGTTRLGARQLLTVVTMAFAGLLLVVTLAFSSDAHLNARLAAWATALNDVDSSPVWGPGYGSFSYRHPQFFNVHNTAIQVLVDVGVLGLSIIIATTWISLRAAGRLLVHAKGRANPDEELLARLAISCCAGLIVAGFGDSFITMPVHAVSGWLTIVVPEFFLILAAPLRLRRL